MKDEPKINYTAMIVGMIASFSLLLASSVGVFDFALSISEKLQEGYRMSIKTNTQVVGEFFDTVSDLSSLKSERDDYKDMYVESRSRVSELENQIYQMQISCDQESLPNFQELDFEPAMVIRYLKQNPGVLVINKGSKDGVEVSNVVVYKHYAVGEVVQVYENSSWVETVLSVKSTVPVVGANGSKGILVSKNGNEYRVEKVLLDQKVDIQESFVTSGINSSYPYGFFVGEVRAIEENASDTTKNLKLQNDLDLSNLREVFIVSNES